VDEDSPEDVFDQEGVEYDYSGVEWEGVPEADELALLEQFMGDNHVSVNQGEADEPPAFGEWT
jgi:hypothetical protein